MILLFDALAALRLGKVKDVGLVGMPVETQHGRQFAGGSKIPGVQTNETQQGVPCIKCAGQESKSYAEPKHRQKIEKSYAAANAVVTVQSKTPIKGPKSVRA
ncbi:hypothetical protein PM082_017512 [Marasmius tenuissimus]|nr:hypothetical protein PM082_017512 [Marasmius tenuissimus]